MEAAACYIGECKNPDTDAKIAMNLEGLYGLFIYTMIPIAFVVVLGAEKLGNPALADPRTIFSDFASAIFGSGASWLDWLISAMLVIALMLSVLNAIMGSGRAVYQMALDGQFPRIFAVGQQARRARVLDGLQRRVLDRTHLHRRSGRDLLALERRLHGLVHPGARRLLPAAQVPSRDAHDRSGCPSS